MILLIEYGSNWTMPVTKWNYATASKNYGPRFQFTANVSQMQIF